MNQKPLPYRISLTTGTSLFVFLVEGEAILNEFENSYFYVVYHPDHLYVKAYNVQPPVQLGKFTDFWGLPI